MSTAKDPLGDLAASLAAEEEAVLLMSRAGR